MRRPTRRDLERRLDELEADAAEIDAEEAYALLVAVASGSATEAERKRWRRVPTPFARKLAGPLEDDA